MGRKGFESKMFYTITLEDLVPVDNFYRKLGSKLNFGFIYKECRELYGVTGNPSLDPVVFFKLLLYGYFENISKDRELIRRVSDSLAARLFIGYDLDEELPWHSTISRTREIMPEEIFDKLFMVVLKMCVDAGLVQGSNQLVDSTLVKANASLESLERKNPELGLVEYIEKTRLENKTEETIGSIIPDSPEQDRDGENGNK